MSQIETETNQNGATKIRQLVDAITRVIGWGDYQRGAALPSVNRLSSELRLSRDRFREPRRCR